MAEGFREPVSTRTVALNDKGIPFDLLGAPISALVGRDVHDGTFPSPRIVAYAERISHNLELMKAWSAANHVQIAPHAKTTMSASLVRRQLAAGACASGSRRPGAGSDPIRLLPAADHGDVRRRIVAALVLAASRTRMTRLRRRQRAQAAVRAFPRTCRQSSLW